MKRKTEKEPKVHHRCKAPMCGERLMGEIQIEHGYCGKHMALVWEGDKEAKLGVAKKVLEAANGDAPPGRKEEKPDPKEQPPEEIEISQQTQPVAAKLPLELRDRMEEMASLRGLSVSAYIRGAVKARVMADEARAQRS